MDKLPTRAQNLFAFNLRRLRNRQGLTQSELAERARISTSFLGTLETGRKFPSPETLDALTDALGADLYQFFQKPGQNSSDRLLLELEQALAAFRGKLDVSYDELTRTFLEEFHHHDTAAENPEAKDDLDP